MSQLKKDKKLIKDFGLVMLGKLRANRHKPIHEHLPIDYFLERISEELKELEEAIKVNHKSAIAMECADIANYCAFIFDNITKPITK